MINMLLKSIVDSDDMPVVICDLEHTIVYMNIAAVKRYSKRGGAELIGKSLMNCHNEKSNQLINDVVKWFEKSTDNNKVFTYRNEKENKDVYMIALRDDSKRLIGYYEKHESRVYETMEKYRLD